LWDRLVGGKQLEDKLELVLENLANLDYILEMFKKSVFYMFFV